MGGGRTELVVPKRRVVTDIAMVGAVSRRMEVFLDEHRDRAWQLQEVLELFEGDRAFLPCLDVTAGACLLINRDQVAWLSVPLVDHPIGESDEPLDLLHEHRRPVRVTLTDGLEMAGDLLFDGPPERARVADYLNRPGRFVCLFESERMILVNKSAVRHVAESTRPEML
jgi:hypothetical protein